MGINALQDFDGEVAPFQVDSFDVKLAILLRETTVEVENSKNDIPTYTGKGSSWKAQNWT